MQTQYAVISKIFTGFMVFTFIPSAQAHTSTANQAREVHTLQVGATAIVSDKGFKNYETETKLLPAVFYDNNKFYVRGNQIGIHLVKHNQHDVDLLAQYVGDSYNADQATGDYRGLDDRSHSTMLGASYQYQLKYAKIAGQIIHDVSNHSQGTIAKVSVGTRLPVDKWLIYPSIGVQWQDTDYNNYYYGVTNSENQRTNIAAYNADASIEPFMSVSAIYQLNPLWQLFINPSMSYKSDEVYNSPKIDKRVAWSTAIGLTYKIR